MADEEGEGGERALGQLLVKEWMFGAHTALRIIALCLASTSLRNEFIFLSSSLARLKKWPALNSSCHALVQKQGFFTLCDAIIVVVLDLPKERG